MVEAVQQMEANQVSFTDFLNQIYTPPTAEDSTSTHTRYKNRTASIFKRLQKERIAAGRGSFNSDYTVSGWEAYNAIQGYVQWDMPRKGDPSDFARVVRGADDAIVKKAEELALAV